MGLVRQISRQYALRPSGFVLDGVAVAGAEIAASPARGAGAGAGRPQSARDVRDRSARQVPPASEWRRRHAPLCHTGRARDTPKI